MPLRREDFYRPLDEYLNELHAQSPIGQQDGRMTTFNYYSASPGIAALHCQYAPTCWAHHFPLEQICWHDDWNDFGAGPTFGNGVAITPRHILCSEHGREVTGYNLVWATDRTANPSPTFVARTIDSVNSIQPEAIYHTEGAGGMRVLYIGGEGVASNIPSSLIARILPESEFPIHVDDFGQPVIDPATQKPKLDIHNLPLLQVNRFNQACIQGIKSLTELTGNFVVDGVLRLEQFFLFDRIHEGALWTQIAAGDSGSPLFLMHNNSTLYYFGNVTQGASAVAIYTRYPNIEEACRILNERHARAFNVPFYMPGRHERLPRELYQQEPRGPLG